MRKRFLIFAGQNFYANNGWCDWRGAVETLDEARALVEVCRTYDAGGFDWWQIVDLETEQIVAKGQFTEHGSSYGDCTAAELQDWQQYRQHHQTNA